MGPPKITEDAKTLAKSKIQSSQKSGEKVKKKRRNSLLDRIRKDAARGRLPISGQQSASPEKHFHPKPKEEDDVDTSGRSKMVKSEDDVPLKGSKEKVAATSTSHLNLKFINTPELPNSERHQRSRHSSWPLRKKTDNELGYDEGRNRNRHQHQQKRQDAYLAYKNNSISSSASDLESD